MHIYVKAWDLSLLAFIVKFLYEILEVRVCK